MGPVRRDRPQRPYTTDPLDAAEQAWLHGIVVAAAGNMGTASDAVSYAPGNDPYVLTAGAVDEQGTARTSDDVTASWSSQGSTQDGLPSPMYWRRGRTSFPRSLQGATSPRAAPAA